MASPVVLKATTLIGQFQELAQIIATYQASAAKNPDGATIITSSSTNDVTGVRTITSSIPTIATIDPTDGSIDRTAVDPFVD